MFSGLNINFKPNAHVVLSEPIETRLISELWACLFTRGLYQNCEILCSHTAYIRTVRFFVHTRLISELWACLFTHGLYHVGFLVQTRMGHYQGHTYIVKVISSPQAKPSFSPQSVTYYAICAANLERGNPWS